MHVGHTLIHTSCSCSKTTLVSNVNRELHNLLSIHDLLWFSEKPVEVRGNHWTQLFTLTLKVQVGCSVPSFQCQPWNRQNIVKQFLRDPSASGRSLWPLWTAFTTWTSLFSTILLRNETKSFCFRLEINAYQLRLRAHSIIFMTAFTE